MGLKRWGTFFLWRLWSATLALGIASVLIFWIASAGPGDFLGDLRSDPQVSERSVAAEAARLRLDESWLARYQRWAWDMSRGEWGKSYSSGIAVRDLLWPRLQQSLWLSGQAMAWVWALALGWAALAVQERSRRWDQLVQKCNNVLLAVPDMVIVLGLALVFARLEQNLDRGVAPVLALGLCILPSLALQCRAAFRRAAEEPFVAAARRRGLAAATITTRYIAPAAAPELSALLGLSLGWALSASLLVECTLGVAGLGPLLWNALLARDVPVVAGASMVSLALWMAGNLTADLLQFVSDPRLRRQAV